MLFFLIFKLINTSKTMDTIQTAGIIKPIGVISNEGDSSPCAVTLITPATLIINWERLHMYVAAGIKSKRRDTADFFST